MRYTRVSEKPRGIYMCVCVCRMFFRKESRERDYCFFFFEERPDFYSQRNQRVVRILNIGLLHVALYASAESPRKDAVLKAHVRLVNQLKKQPRQKSLFGAQEWVSHWQRRESHCVSKSARHRSLMKESKATVFSKHSSRAATRANATSSAASCAEDA